MKETNKISERKIRAVKELAELIDKNNTVMFCSIKSLPSQQFQKIKKELTDKAEVKVVKKSILLRALEMARKKTASGLKDYVKEDTAVLISDTEPFELSSILSESKVPVKAKIGQEAEEDIVIDAGPTELTPGPIISELGSLGLKIEVKEGKIEIRETKIIVKKGEKIKEAAVSLMTKLDIKPFSVGFIPIVAYDSKEEKIYTEIRIDKKKTLEQLKETFAKANGLAIAISYICKETIKFLLVKANSQEKILANLINVNTQENKS